MSSGAEAISLPSGGGALQGIGETFSADLHTGTGNFTVPIALPAGRNSFQPDLSLAYSTGNGNGPFGLGWSLSIPGIGRKTSKGVPRYDDTEDTFILSGTEDLVPVERAPGRTRYRPRTEGLFARINRHHDGTNDYWEVRSKDGLVSYYGIPGRAGRDPTVVADPMEGGRVFSWNLARTVDPHGNRMDYEYERDTGEDAFHHWDQLYLKRIRYADYADAEATGYLISVSFEYEDRPDPFSDRRAGFEVRTRRRCRFIRVTTHADEDRPVLAYRLTYVDQLSGEDLPPNGVSLLAGVTVVGADGDIREELPPLEFGYTRFEPQKREFSAVGGKNAPAASLTQPGYELVDLSGNGLPDVLEMNGTVRYWRNLGDGLYDTPREMREAPAGLSLADAGVQLVDADGDGRTDLLVTRDGIAGYYPTRFGGAWDRRSFQRYARAPSFDLEDPEVRLVDLDGDGITDAIRSGTSLECFFNGNGDGWNETRRVERRAIGSFPNVSFSDPRLRWADVTGDGLQDIVLVHDGNVEYWPSRGRGDWGRRVSMRASPSFPEGYDPRRILLGDVDGDGLADIVYVGDNTVTLWINQGGDAWSQAFEIRGTPSVTDADSVRLSDMLGAGVAGVLWSAEGSSGTSRGGMHFLDFTGGTKPYLLSETDNNTGALTRIGYAPSTRFFLEDEGRPETRWKTPLPFPVQVVARVEAIDAISGGKLTSEYAYHHGYWDGAEREFRGFGRVDQRDTETFEDFETEGLHPRRSFAPVRRSNFSPPTETRTWFHQGPAGDEFGGWDESNHAVEFWRGDPQVLSRPQGMENFLKGLPRRARRDALRTLRGRVLRTELYAMDGTNAEDRPYTVTEHLHGLREEAPPGEGEDRPRVFFPHALAERTTQWERGSDPMVKFDFTGQYDAYGQPGSALSLAVPRGRDPGEAVTPGSSEPYLATQMLTDYARRDDDEVFIADRVARVTKYEIPNDGTQSLFSLARSAQEGTAEKRIIGQTINFYDGPAFTGLAFGKIGARGALVRSETLAVTEGVLREAYPAGDPLLTVPAEPPYWASSGSPVWPSEYPQAFATALPTDRHADPTRPGLAITPLKYGFSTGEADSPYARGYFAATERRSYDFHGDPEGRGLVEVTRDAADNNSKVEFDPYGLLPVAATDAAGLSTRAAHDYRVLKPASVTDPNGNTTLYSYSPLGLLKAVVVTGKGGEGDTPEEPGSRYEYDFGAFDREKQPISVRTIRRVHHTNDADVPQPERDEETETVEYSDGFGRLIQARTRAEDLVFGDPDFGGGVLPADQSNPAGDAEDVIGRPIIGGPRVVVSGWQAYDNKGRVVERHEPFFSEGWAYGWGERLRARLRTFYDPLGRAIRTLNPDGTEQRVVYGVPEDLSDPSVYEPTPWETYTYDANDNAGRTHPETTSAYGHHRNTPNSATVDALGRAVETVDRAGPGAQDRHVTRSSYDIRGNLLSVTDALGRAAFRHVYDLANRTLRSAQLDAGSRRAVFDPAGGEVEKREGRGALLLSSYDGLRRLSRVWARDEREGRITLRELRVYGDGGTPDQPTTAREVARAANLLGKLYHHHDEAGRLTLEGYDFKGNVLERARQTISDAAILSVFSPPPPDWRVGAYRVDWQPPSGTTLAAHADKLLDKRSYATSLAYDALNRMRLLRYPQTVDGTRKTLLPRYDLGGSLRSVGLDGQTFVGHIAYDAKGQRTLVAYGNGLMTRHAYDEKTFRLTRTRTERYTKPAADGPAYRPSGAPLQDLLYQYDLSDNVLGIVDRTPGCGVMSNPEALQETDPVLAQRLTAGDALIRRFEYDPLYRLTSATGRECKDVPKPRPWADAAYCGYGSGGHGMPDQGNAPNLTATYREIYAYDPAGNMTSLRHQAGGDAWTRRFGVGGLTPEQWDAEWPKHQGTDEWAGPPGNRLTHVGAGNAAQTHFYDACGNLVDEGAGRHFEWDHAGRMRAYRTQSGTAEPSVHAHYLYDAGGARVKKLVRKGASVEVTTYIDGAFEHHRLVKAASTAENNTLHVMDEGSRVAMVRVGTPFTEDAAPAVRYHLGDHLGSSALVVDAGGGWINREEYTPYGETSFGSFARKRYRFTGKERDEESGLYYHGARYFAPWLCRWTSSDPAGLVDGPNLYLYARGSPSRFLDPSGLAKEDSAKSATNIQPQRGQEGYVAPYNKQPSKVKLGEEKAIKEHLVPGAQLEALTMDPSTGEADYRNHGPEYRRDATYLNPESKAMDKTHTSLEVPSDNKRTEAVKKLQSDATKGLGPGADLNKDLLVPSIEHAVETKTPRHVANRAALEQAGNLFSLQRLKDTAKRIVENPRVVRAAGHLRTAAKRAGAAVPVAGAIIGHSSAAHAAATGDVQGAALDEFGNVPVAGDLVDAGRAGYSVGEAINEFLPEDVQNAIGGTINEIVNEGGWKEIVRHPFGIGMW